MRRLIYLAAVLILLSVVIGCAGMSAEQRNVGYDLGSSVGGKPIVGPPSAAHPELHGMSWGALYGA